MAHVAVEHVGDGFESTMRVRREAADIVVRVIGIEFVEHQKRIHIQTALAAQTAAQFDTGAIGSGNRLYDTDQGTGTHVKFSLRPFFSSGAREASGERHAARRAISAMALARPASLCCGLTASPSAYTNSTSVMPMKRRKSRT